MGDHYRIDNFSYNGATEFEWLGFLIVNDINTTGFDVLLGDAVINADRTSGNVTRTESVNWNQGYLILSFIYWPTGPL